MLFLCILIFRQLYDEAQIGQSFEHLECKSAGARHACAHPRPRLPRHEAAHSFPMSIQDAGHVGVDIAQVEHRVKLARGHAG